MKNSSFSYFLVTRTKDNFYYSVIEHLLLLDGKQVEFADADLTVVLGGDGSVLSAARESCDPYYSPFHPIIVINRGHLGFLSSCTEIGDQPQLESLEKLIDKFLTGNLNLTRRELFSCKLFELPEGDTFKSRIGNFYGVPKLIQKFKALNDITIKNSGSRLVTCSVYAQHDQNLEFVSDYRADGLIISTPTGSTAYNLSAGGPIVHTGVACSLITPICPQGLTQRPLVLPKEYEIFVIPVGKDLYLSIDGQTSHPLQENFYIEIDYLSNFQIKTVNPEISYFEVLRKKLGWGIPPVT